MTQKWTALLIILEPKIIDWKIPWKQSQTAWNLPRCQRQTVGSGKSLGSGREFVNIWQLHINLTNSLSLSFLFSNLPRCHGTFGVRPGICQYLTPSLGIADNFVRLTWRYQGKLQSPTECMRTIWEEPLGSGREFVKIWHNHLVLQTTLLTADLEISRKAAISDWVCAYNLKASLIILFQPPSVSETVGKKCMRSDPIHFPNLQWAKVLLALPILIWSGKLPSRPDKLMIIGLFKKAIFISIL